MEKDTKQNNVETDFVRDRFDQTLGQHLERLIGSRYGVDSLPLNLATISCFILLADRENELENFPSDTSERYTRETLLNELVEIGLEPDSDLKKVLQDVIEKGYIDVDDGKFITRKPTISMVQLLDNAFPKMPGMNFIAYFVQTMDEALSGRKDLDFAITQFDQTLHIQGVSILKQKAGQKSKQKQPVMRKIKLEDLKLSRVPRSGPRLMSSKGKSKKIEIKEISSLQDEILKASPEIDEAIEDQKTDIPQEEIMGSVDTTAEAESPYVEPGEPSESLSDIPSEPGLETGEASDETTPSDESSEDMPSSHETTSPTIKPPEEETEIKSVEADETDKKDETVIVSEEASLEKDDDIEKQIAALEEDLSMQCPICKSGNIQANETGAGKTYYKCSNKTCTFISWGKPYHLVCPQCDNPFLIEAPVKGGKTVLKCPRSTCNYSQKLPGEITEEPGEETVSQAQKPKKSTKAARKPRRRVVKRRVVRKKR